MVWSCRTLILSCVATSWVSTLLQGNHLLSYISVLSGSCRPQTWQQSPQACLVSVRFLPRSKATPLRGPTTTRNGPKANATTTKQSSPSPAVEQTCCSRCCGRQLLPRDRKSTRLNSSHVSISYAV